MSLTWMPFPLWLLIPGVLISIAPGAHGAQSPPAPQERPAQISDRELQAFVKTYVETQNIRREYEPPIEKSSDPERKRKLHQSADQELKEALTRNNLTVDRYNQIFARVNNDASLREKVLRMVDEERKRSTTPPSRLR